MIVISLLLAYYGNPSWRGDAGTLGARRPAPSRGVAGQVRQHAVKALALDDDLRVFRSVLAVILGQLHGQGNRLRVGGAAGRCHPAIEPAGLEHMDSSR